MVAVVIPDTAETVEEAAAAIAAATTTADVIEAAEAGADISVTGPVMDAAMAAAVVMVDDRVADTKAEAAGEEDAEEDAAHHGRRPTKHTECSPTSSRFSAILRQTVGPGWCIMPTLSMPSGGRRLDPTDRPSSE